MLPLRFLRIRLLSSALLLLALLCPRALWADVQVGILGLDPVDAPEATARVVSEALRQRAAQSGGIRLLPSKDLVEVKLVFGCMDERPACLQQAGRSLGADRLVYGSLRKPAQGGGYTVVLKQLNVRTGQVEKFINETPPSRVFHAESTELQAITQRWLQAVLLTGLTGGLVVDTEPPGAAITLDGVVVGQSPLSLRDVSAGSHVARIELVDHQPVIRAIEIKGGLTHELHVVLAKRGKAAPAISQGPPVGDEPMAKTTPMGKPVLQPVPPPSVEKAKGPDRGKPFRVLSYFLIGAAAITGGVSIYTWRSYVNEGEPARQALDVLQMKIPGSPEVSAFFSNGDRLASCEPPAELTVRAMADPVTITAYNNYLEHCRKGRSQAAATTGLVATMGSLALLGVTSFIIGEKLRTSKKADEAKTDKDKKKAAYFYTPRLREIAPALSTQGGGLDLHFEF